MLLFKESMLKSTKVLIKEASYKKQIYTKYTNA